MKDIPHDHKWRDMFMFRYTKASSRQAILARLKRFWDKENCDIMKRRQVFSGFSVSDIEGGAQSIQLKSILKTKNRSSSWAELIPASRRELLARRVDLWCLNILGPAHAFTVNISLACRNELPALGYELWTAKRIRLFGGDVVVSARTRQTLIKVASQMRKLFSVPLREDFY